MNMNTDQSTISIIDVSGKCLFLECLEALRLSACFFPFVFGFLSHP